MARPNPTQKPTFFWQGLLIVLPVVALAVVGFLSLRQDRRMAEAEARQRANEVADSLAVAIEKDFGITKLHLHPLISNPSRLEEEVHRFLAFATSPDEEPIFQWSEGLQPNDHYQVALLNHDHQLVYPPPLHDVPLPPFIEKPVLTAEQSNLWSQVLTAEFVQRDFSNAVAICNRLLQTSLPPGWSARITYDAGMLLKAQGKWREALEKFLPLARNDAENLSEGGIPLRQIALLQIGTMALEDRERAQIIASMWNEKNSTDTNDPTTVPGDSGWVAQIWTLLCVETITRPTVMSEYFLNQALEKAPSHEKEAIAGWLRVWQSHQASREVYQHLIQSGSAKSDSKFGWRSDDAWVGSLNASGTNEVLMAQPKSDVVNRIRELLKKLGASPFTGSLFEYAPYFAKVNSLAYLTTNSAIDKKTLQIPNRLSLYSFPPYFGVMVEIDGEANPEFHSEFTEAISPLAERSSAHGVFGTSGDSAVVYATGSTPFSFKVTIFLADPAALYGRQKQRALIFGLLIAVSAIAALIGFFAARRAFHRQLYLSEMKSNFVSSVSHELRAPIASVRLMAEGLERGRVTDPQKQNEYFRFIVQECRRLSSLIENVLDFSRIEQGRKQYEFEPTDVAALAQQTVKLMDTYAAEQQIQLALQVTGEPAPIEMDGKAMQQALINLIDNAIKHSPKGATVSIGVEFESVPKSALRLWVEDIGEGIPAGEQEKIFERFYRLGSELRRETQGVGIGLSIVKHIVEAHGGKIIVRSAPGQGSRFTMQLPGQQP